MLPLTTLRDAFVKNLRCVRASNNALAPVNKRQIDTLIDAVSVEPLTPVKLASAVSLLGAGANIGMKPIEPLSSSNPLDYACFQFGQGRTGWYFMYGHMGSMAFNFMIFRIELSTPCILKKMNISPADGCLYGIVGGYGDRSGPWTTLPRTIVQVKYTCSGNGFSFSGVPNDGCPWLTTCELSLSNGVVRVDLEWNSPTPVVINATLTPKKSPVFQGNKGCKPCIGGIGTLYWSYTNMAVSAHIGPTTSAVDVQGVGWFDHQWFGYGGLTSKLIQLLVNIQGMFSTPVPTRWFWLTLQLDGDVQYMIVSQLSALPIQGNSYHIDVVKTDKDGSTHDLTGSAVIKTMTQVGSQSFPTEYMIYLDNSVFNLKAAFGNSVVYLPAGVLNWEGPGDLFDVSGKQIGVGFLEANQLMPEYDLMSIPATSAGIGSDKVSLFLQKRTSCCTGILSISIFLMIIGLIMFVIYLAGKGLMRLVKRD